MAVKLAVSKVDHHGRSQIPTQVRRYIGLGKEGRIVFWVVEERIVVDKEGAGTPNPFSMKAGYRPFIP